MTDITEEKVTKTQVPVNKRMGFLANKIPPALAFRFENAIYTLTETMAGDQYHGGYWEFYELSNGGFYMAPNVDKEKQFDVTVQGNMYQGKLSGDALGIVVTLTILSHMSFHVSEHVGQRVAALYHSLREYMLDSDHPEVVEMIQATD